MRRLIINLLIGVLTFGVGLVASMLWGDFLSTSVQPSHKTLVTVSKTRLAETVIEPRQSRCGCLVRDEKVGSTRYVTEQPRAAISAGVLNSKALSLPLPVYSSVARAARASGTVTVQVFVDESGCVQSARAISGHPLLQWAATEAAQQACFTPTLLSGKPVTVSGVIIYTFSQQ